MSINVSLKKIVIIAAILLVVGGSVYWFVSTKNVRTRKSEYKALIRYAQRQLVEIAIIEQTSKLENYKQQIAENQKVINAKLQSQMAPNPPIISPLISDPVDIE